MSRSAFIRRHTFIALLVAFGVLATVVVATILPLTIEDFYVPGTQMGSITPTVIKASTDCAACHANFDRANEPYATWRGSLMGNAGRDPLFFAQMTLANQDVVNAGYYCMRCHVPAAIVTGHALPADGSALTAQDGEGVSCHLCHSMVDPIYRDGISPSGDATILAALGANKPDYYGNAMFVLDPLGNRRSARTNPQALHEFIPSPFHASGNMCGTCHEVGNVAVTREPDGTYQYNAVGLPSPTSDPAHQFPLERTFTEWRLSAFAGGGVDMGGRFGGVGTSVVSSCQDCHMPRASAKLCIVGPTRPNARRHELAGAAAQVLDLIAKHTQGDPGVDQAALLEGRAAAVSMLRRAASLSSAATASTLNVRVTNESGHKLPTGHIEGRRVWVNVRFIGRGGGVIQEHGAYDTATATLDAASTTVYEMRVGLSAAAAGLTGLPVGQTERMALANTIEKDNRLPPRGFNNDAYAAGGAPAVGHVYADGQYWDDLQFAIPPGAARAEVALYYQNTPREYIEHLRDANTTDSWGATLYSLWQSTGKGLPIEMAASGVPLEMPLRSDFDRNGLSDADDLFAFLDAWFAQGAGADFDGSGAVLIGDVFEFLNAWFEGD
jgi:hypothetical protein